MNKILAQKYIGNNESVLIYTCPVGKEVVINQVLLTEITSNGVLEHNQRKYSVYIVKNGSSIGQSNVVENNALKTIKYIGLTEGDFIFCESVVGNINIQLFGEEKDIGLDDDYKNSIILFSNYIKSVLGPNQIAHNNKVISCPCPS